MVVLVLVINVRLAGYVSAVLIQWMLQGKEGLHSLQAMLESAQGPGSAGPGSDTSKLGNAYRAAWITTVVVAAVIAFFTIVALLWRIGQRLKAEGRIGKGEHATVVGVVFLMGHNGSFIKLS